VYSTTEYINRLRRRNASMASTRVFPTEIYAQSGETLLSRLHSSGPNFEWIYPKNYTKKPHIQSSSILPVAIALHKQSWQLSFSSRRGLSFLLLYGSRDTQATTAICPQCSYTHYSGDVLGVGTPLVLLVVRRESYNKVSTSSLDR